MADRSKEFYASSNGDRWFLAKDEATSSAYVIHRANQPAGGQITQYELATFLVRGRGSPEQGALLRLIATIIDQSGDAKSTGPAPL